MPTFLMVQYGTVLKLSTPWSREVRSGRWKGGRRGAVKLGCNFTNKGSARYHLDAISQDQVSDVLPAMCCSRFCRSHARKKHSLLFSTFIINCLVPLNVLGEVCAIKRGAGGGYNISEQQLFEALKMNYTGDSFICL